jgi:uncharacterized protein YbjQ (UPF0145 family)
MILVTTDAIPGREIERVIGLVRGNTVRSAPASEDLHAWFENVVGGEIPEYTRLLAQCREQALDRVVADARAKGADAVVALRFVSCEIAEGAAEILAYGTAVKLRAG